VPPPTEECEVPGAAALRSIDEAIAQQICSSKLADLRSLEPDKTSSLGTWMIWMVQRAAANDPSLTSFNFRQLMMPAPEDEPRIAPKLMSAVATNTHLLEMSLSGSNLRGNDQAVELGGALSSNHTLQVLNIEGNALDPSDLEAIFKGLARNKGLKELRCSDQYCEEEAGMSVFKVAHESLRTNFTLLKLGLCLSGKTHGEQNYKDQILKALIRNMEVVRKRRKRQEEEVVRPQSEKVHREAFREKELSGLRRKSIESQASEGGA
jgi:hypothetical protein